MAESSATNTMIAEKETSSNSSGDEKGFMEKEKGGEVVVTDVKQDEEARPGEMTFPDGGLRAWAVIAAG